MVCTQKYGKKIIKNNLPVPVFLLDGDDQGRKYIEKYALDFYEQGANVKICHLDEGTDLADFICARGRGLGTGKLIDQLLSCSLKACHFFLFTFIFKKIFFNS
jgi:DNA primase